ncbi:MAG: DUF4178 domain-containing protein, partial [Myxococcota bacterium]
MFTGLLIAILVIAGAATAVAGGLVISQRRRSLSGQSSTTPQLTDGSAPRLLERTIREMRTGDILTFEGVDYLVEGVIAYDEDGHRWSAGRIVDGSDSRWVIVGMERGGSLIIRVVKSVTDLDIDGYPPETLLLGQARFNLDKRGTATARMSGDTGLGGGQNSAASGMDTVMRCRWWMYDSPGDDTVIVEQ